MTEESTDMDERRPAYVLVDCAGAPGGADLDSIRGLTLADSCARFLRARSHAALLSIAVDAGPVSASDASQLEPGTGVEERLRRIRERVESLGCSCDWDRVFPASEEELRDWTRHAFAQLREHDLVYRRGERWLVRLSPYLDEVERALQELRGWDAAAIESQRAAAERIDGVEVRAGTFGGGELTVFTPHPDAIAKTRFVAVSPAHPQIGEWTSDANVAKQVAAIGAGEWHGEDAAAPLVVTGALATVPGVDGIVPIVVSPLVDRRFGPTAVLGIPERDPADRAIAGHLPPSAGAAWKTSNAGSAAHPAVRYRAQDSDISSAAGAGLQVASPDSQVPQPGSSADAIDPRFADMASWAAACVPAARRGEHPLGDSESARWLPAALLVAPTDAGVRLLERRLLARALQDSGCLPPLAGREPFSRVLLYEKVGLSAHDRAAPAVVAPGSEGTSGDDQAPDVDELVERAGADAVRLALLSAAAPGNGFRWTEEPLRRSERFLARLRDYAAPRLSDWAERSGGEPADIDPSERLRRRLALWRAVACEKLTLSYQDLQLHRAAHEAMLFLKRIQDFEARAGERRELEPADREAIAAALVALARLLAPMTPHIAQELWSAAGSHGLVGEERWPELTRPARVASTPGPAPATPASTPGRPAPAPASASGLAPAA
jgi:leucyl-tRNA synthetase